MNKIICVMLLVFLISCNTTTTDTSKEQPRTPMDNVVDVLKGIQLPKY